MTARAPIAAPSVLAPTSLHSPMRSSHRACASSIAPEAAAARTTAPHQRQGVSATSSAPAGTKSATLSSTP
ncbi:hypothetical protein ASG76_00800 [Nocardioides sp. Soil774]|nr:hypothetical protein ASG76_00800 [Nocardioides sp. Soil774]